MVARVAERQREFAVRAALGAGKLRLARLALAESLLLSLAAGGIGLLVASFTVTAQLSRVRYPTTEHGAVFLEELLERARAMPGLVSVALSDSSPPPCRPERC
jgi:ABC-type antimicrobial peptide transport system permease subunit